MTVFNFGSDQDNMLQLFFDEDIMNIESSTAGYSFKFLLSNHLANVSFFKCKTENSYILGDVCYLCLINILLVN